MSLYYLVKRNILLYFKDRAAVFFSLLSVLMILLLMVVFLGDMNADSILESLQQIKGVKPTEVDKDHVQYFVLMWTIAGMLAVNSFTVPLSIIGIYVQDKQYHKLESFFCAPISRLKLMSGYLIAAIVNGMIMCSITLVLSCIYVNIQGYEFLSFIQWVQVYGLLLVSVAVSSSMILFVSQYIHTSNAWGSLNTIAGTLIGFLGGIYLPMTMLPLVVQNVLKALPFLHQSSLLRTILTDTAIHQTFEGLPNSIIAMYNDRMGITVEMFQQQINVPSQILLLVACGIIALSFSLYALRKHSIFE